MPHRTGIQPRIRRSPLRWLAVLAAASVLASPAPAEEGISAGYRGDAGIAADPRVLFHEDFESGSLEKWDEVRGAGIASEGAHAGRFCAEMKLVRGEKEVSDAMEWFEGHDRVHVRFYVKFSANYQYPHHFVTLLANHPTNRWSAFGKAGRKPDGSYFSSGMEPWFAWGRNPPPGELNLYSYYVDMEPDRRMNKYWGNSFFPPGPGKGKAASESRVIPKLNEWQCWEFMVEANSAPEKADGRQAMWVDGKKIAEFTGIRWRTLPEVKINCLWLQHYGYDGSDPTREYWKDQQTVWFDDVVAATSYIGPRTE